MVDNNHRIRLTVRLSRKSYRLLNLLAVSDNRSLSNEIEKLIVDFARTYRPALLKQSEQEEGEG